VALPDTRHPTPDTRRYARALRALAVARVPYVVGGTWALRHYGAPGREIEDLDLMIEPGEVERAVTALAGPGWSVIQADPAQTRLGQGDGAVDLVHHFAQGYYPVDASWHRRGVPARIGAVPTLVACPEALIWSKAFVAARHRFDGADVVHLFHWTRGALDWDWLIDRFQPFPHVLLAYLNLFEFCYPATRDVIPGSVWETLLAVAERPAEPSGPNVCLGTLLDRASFEFDVIARGYQQATAGRSPS
jgi:hypothetical protein